ncbi:hypothetical protein LCGC14_1818250 [marine sediment metagenome]|uniref:Uncharacterized protein n=1 Tax=marine sediment metagenome TaxID=412755 RepID=A0A0F9H7T7_9ZZZZ
MPPGALGLFEVANSCAPTAEDVYPLGHGLQMLRVDTVSDAAQVIELKPIGDWAYEPLVRNSVDAGALAVQ